MSCIDLTDVHKCSVCLNDMCSPIWLGCHVFCQECITSWILNSATCPTCRMNIPPDLETELRSHLPRRSTRVSKPTVMFTTDGVQSSSVTSREMMQRVEDIEY